MASHCGSQLTSCLGSDYAAGIATGSVCSSFSACVQGSACTTAGGLSCFESAPSPCQCCVQDVAHCAQSACQGDLAACSATVLSAAIEAGSCADAGMTSGPDSSVDSGTASMVDSGTAVDSSAAVDASAPDSGPPVDASSGDADAGCVGLQCSIPTCGAGTTTITGKLLDPAARNPVYGAAVYVPNAPVSPLAVGAACACPALSGSPIVAALTAADGTFSLSNVPAGTNIPLVVQVGKWRRQYVVPSITACAANPLAAPLTLPSNGSQGDMPEIAVSTGGADTLECLLSRIGIASSEYVPGASAGGHVHVFQGAGGRSTSPAAPSSPTSLWDTQASLMAYDALMLSCEGAATTTPNPAALAAYLNAGGRVFAEHFHYAFFAGQTQFPNVATWSGGGTYPGPITGTVQSTLLSTAGPFPQGAMMQTWLTDVGALSGGTLAITPPKQDAVVSATNVATPWIATSAGVNPPSTQLFSWEMPSSGSACGRAFFSDVHAAGASTAEDYTSSMVVPTGCASVAPTADEDAIEFVLFDLVGCLTTPGSTPALPPFAP